MKKAAFASLALVLATGCESPFGESTDPAFGISFDVTADAYSPGAFVEYRLSNRSNRDFLYNLCFAFLERDEGDRWVIGGSSGTCAAVGLTLRPGETVAGGEVLPADLSPGAYRFTVRVGASESYLHTRTFAVE